MEEVVKEMSHLFQFFPEEIPPLNYPYLEPIDAADKGGILHTVHKIPCCSTSKVFFPFFFRKKNRSRANWCQFGELFQQRNESEQLIQI